MGMLPAEKRIQIKSIDDDLRNSLWNALTIFYWKTFKPRDRLGVISGSTLDRLFHALWWDYFKKPLDTIPRYYGDNNGGLNFFRKYFFDATWHEVYDFIEFIPLCHPGRAKEFRSLCNQYLERENSAYRFVNGRIAEITSSDEIEEIENAMSHSIPYDGVREHLHAALLMLSDRTNPDYRNSIKESISAVESLCRTVSGNDKAMLSAALKILKDKGLHPALESAFQSLYGYTSDANGIRHALLEKSNLTSAEARFMLIICSAFTNYAIATTSEA